MPRKRKAAPRLKRLRKTVNKWNYLYGLLVTAIDAVRERVLDLENRYDDDDRTVERGLERDAELLALGE